MHPYKKLFANIADFFTELKVAKCSMLKLASL